MCFFIFYLVLYCFCTWLHSFLYSWYLHSFLFYCVCLVLLFNTLWILVGFLSLSGIVCIWLISVPCNSSLCLAVVFKRWIGRILPFPLMAIPLFLILLYFVLVNNTWIGSFTCTVGFRSGFLGCFNVVGEKRVSYVVLMCFVVVERWINSWWTLSNVFLTVFSLFLVKTNWKECVLKRFKRIYGCIWCF